MEKIREHLQKSKETLDYHVQKSKENIEAFQQKIGFNKDKYKDLNQIVRNLNYPFEKHYYNTADDYINCVFRINGPRGTNAKQNDLKSE
jgi:endonuclease III